MVTKSRKNHHVVWIWIDNTYPWIELEGTYATLKEAVDAGEKSKHNLKIKAVNISQPQTKKEVLAVPLIET